MCIRYRPQHCVGCLVVHRPAKASRPSPACILALCSPPTTLTQSLWYDASPSLAPLLLYSSTPPLACIGTSAAATATTSSAPVSATIRVAVQPLTPRWPRYTRGAAGSTTVRTTSPGSTFSPTRSSSRSPPLPTAACARSRATWRPATAPPSPPLPRFATRSAPNPNSTRGLLSTDRIVGIDRKSTRRYHVPKVHGAQLRA